MFRRHAFFLLVVIVFTASPILAVPIQDVKLMSDGELLERLKVLREEMTKLREEIETPAATGRPDRKAMDFTAYRETFDAFTLKIDDAYKRLAGYHGQIDRLYRTAPNAPLYKQIVKEYLDTKTAFDAAKSAFGIVPAPETLRVVATVSSDRRLNDRVADSLKGGPRPDQPGAARDILQADESRFIGTFDAVEMFLLVKGDTACYVLFGWKEQLTDDSGKKSQRYHLSVVRSDFFPVAGLGEGWSPERHLEKALTLPLVPVDARGEVLNDVNQFLTRVKSYSRTD